MEGVDVCIYIYIYIYRERERERDLSKDKVNTELTDLGNLISSIKGFLTKWFSEYPIV